MEKQNVLVEKFQEWRNKFKSFLDKHDQPSDDSVEARVEGKEDFEFDVDDKVATAPRTNRQILSDGSGDAQNLVWDNEDASMQDKSYSFDEETTDADYDLEDDFEFDEDSETDGGQASRYN